MSEIPTYPDEQSIEQRIAAAEARGFAAGLEMAAWELRWRSCTCGIRIRALIPTAAPQVKVVPRQFACDGSCNGTEFGDCSHAVAQPRTDCLYGDCSKPSAAPWMHQPGCPARADDTAARLAAAEDRVRVLEGALQRIAKARWCTMSMREVGDIARAALAKKSEGT